MFIDYNTELLKFTVELIITSFWHRLTLFMLLCALTRTAHSTSISVTVFWFPRVVQWIETTRGSQTDNTEYLLLLFFMSSFV